LGKGFALGVFAIQARESVVAVLGDQFRCQRSQRILADIELRGKVQRLEVDRQRWVN
jgi:hypothetical protein